MKTRQSKKRHDTKLEAGGGRFQRSFQALSLSLSRLSLKLLVCAVSVMKASCLLVVCLIVVGGNDRGEGQQSAMGCNLFHLSLVVSWRLFVCAVRVCQSLSVSLSLVISLLCSESNEGLCCLFVPLFVRRHLKKRE